MSNDSFDASKVEEIALEMVNDARRRFAIDTSQDDWLDEYLYRTVGWRDARQGIPPKLTLIHGGRAES